MYKTQKKAALVCRERMFEVFVIHYGWLTLQKYMKQTCHPEYFLDLFDTNSTKIPKAVKSSNRTDACVQKHMRTGSILPIRKWYTMTYDEKGSSYN